MAGDIFTSHPLRPHRTDQNSEKLRARYRKFTHHELGKYKRVLYVMGNHEPYREIFEDAAPLLRAFLAEHAPQARLLDNEVDLIPTEGGEIAVLGTTLWAPCAVPSGMISQMQNAMNDFNLITTRRPDPPGVSFYGRHKDQRIFHPVDAYDLHQEAIAWLESELPKHQQVIVMSHHAPSLESSARHLFNSPGWLEDAYCSNLVDLIMANPQIKVFVHGHTHRDVDYMIGGTRILANHRGYFPHERISRHFDPSAKDFEIG